jgi:Pro-kumamolisin, activation domain/Bacterial Ig-like domain (group 1)/OmpA-like transmembrane domain
MHQKKWKSAAAMRPCLQWAAKRAMFALIGLSLSAAETVAFSDSMSPIESQQDVMAVLPTAPDPNLAGAPHAGAPGEIAHTPEQVASSAITIGPAPPRAIGPEPAQGYVRLPGHVLDSLKDATLVDRPSASRASRSSARSKGVPLTIVLKHDDEVGFDQYMEDVYDRQSSHYRQFLTPGQLARRFGPSKETYSQLSAYLRTQGFKVTQRSKNRLTLTVRGTRAQAERAFAVHISDYTISGKNFFANDADPALPAALASRIVAIAGLSNLATPRNVYQDAVPNVCAASTAGTYIETGYFVFANIFLYALFPEALILEAVDLAAGGTFSSLLCLYADNVQGFSNYMNATTAKNQGYINSLNGGGNNGAYNYVDPKTGVPGIRSIGAATHGKASSSRASSSASSTIPQRGTGQTIGLLEFDTYKTSDVTDYLNYVSTLGGYAGTIGNLSQVPVNGGVSTPGSGESEVLLDIDTVLSIAPGAKIVVFSTPFTGQATDYSAAFNAMIEHGVTVISNSWASCEDQMSLAEAQGIDTVLKNAAAAGISVFNGTGDGGSTCVDGTANTISVPADSPNATAVGGTSLIMGPAFTYGSETWWNGTNSTPATGQGGFGVSKFFSRPSYQNGIGTSAMRSIPDVAVAADPAHGGTQICQADAGGCPIGPLSGGTSMSAPIWAGFAASLNQAQGKNLGLLNPTLYPLAGTNAFHSASSMGSDFAHVGLGSPNLLAINEALNGQTTGLPSSTMSGAIALARTFSISATSVMVPADGTSQGGVMVTLVDANGNTVAGKTVTLAASGGNALLSPASAVTDSNGSAIFMMTDLTAETVTYTATDATDGVPVTQTASVIFGVPSAASAGLTANPSVEPADGATAASIIVTLKDSLGRPAPGKTVTLADANGHAVITGPAPSVSDANGTITFSATDQVNETATFTAFDVSDNLAVPQSATVTYSGSTSTACGVGTVPTAGAGYTITPYITGVPAAANLFFGGANIGCPGANSPAFTSAGNVLVTDFLNGNIYQTGITGGGVSSGNLLGTLTPALGGLVYGKDGSVYATLGNGNAQIVQIDPTTGAQLRVVASNLTCPAGLTVDPLSGDLFFDDDCTGGGTDNASIFRVIDPANTNAGSPTSVVVYATLPATPNGGMAFAPNGTLYAVSGYFVNPDAPVEQISGTNSATVTVTPVAGVTSTFGLAIGAANANGSAQSLIVLSSAGALSEVPIANPGAAIVLASANAPNPGVTGPDGCMYAAAYDTIYKIANSSGGCTFAPTSPAPSINLTPSTVSPNPAQGGSQTIVATLKNVGTLAGVPVIFQIDGANPQIKLVDTDADGNATLTYTGVHAGADSVVASATAGSTAVTSNKAQLTWGAGKDVASLSLNLSAHGGTVNQPVNVTASLSDVSASPATSLAGQSISITLGSAGCTAITTSTGVATCSLTPPAAGPGTLTATFAGSSTLAAANQSIGFNVSVGPTGNSTGTGTGSGSGSGSGTPTVTVTVTAKSGGGALSWYAVLLLAMLVLLRLRASPPSPRSSRLIRGGAGIALTWALIQFSAIDSAHAESAAGTPESSAADQPTTAVDPYYVGFRAGSMPLRQDSSKIDQGLASLGFPNVTATSDIAGAAGTVFLGYSFIPQAAIELGYTYRDSTTAHLTGTIPSSSRLTPLLQDTAELTRGYGNIVSLSYSGRFELLPRFSLEPRLGGFFWATKAIATSLDDRIDTTHEGSGVTAGLTAAYRVWRGIELGVSVDHFRGFPNNIATLYAGTLVWRFGP